MSADAREQAVGHHARDLVQRCLEFDRIENVQAVNIEDHIAVVG